MPWRDQEQCERAYHKFDVVDNIGNNHFLERPKREYFFLFCVSLEEEKWKKEEEQKKRSWVYGVWRREMGKLSEIIGFSFQGELSWWLSLVDYVILTWESRALCQFQQKKNFLSMSIVVRGYGEVMLGEWSSYCQQNHGWQIAPVRRGREVEKRRENIVFNSSFIVRKQKLCNPCLGYLLKLVW